MSKQMLLPSEELRKMPANEKVHLYVRLKLTRAAKQKILTQAEESDRALGYVISSALESYYGEK